MIHKNSRKGFIPALDEQDSSLLEIVRGVSISQAYETQLERWTL